MVLIQYLLGGGKLGEKTELCAIRVNDDANIELQCFVLLRKENGRHVANKDVCIKVCDAECWTRCLKCQMSAGIVDDGKATLRQPHHVEKCSNDNFKYHFMGIDVDGKATLRQSHHVEKFAVGSSSNSGVVCAICREKGESTPWAQNLSSDMHGCGYCKSVFPKEHWSAKKLEHHKRLDRDLVCDTCEQRGFTPSNLYPPTRAVSPHVSYELTA